MTRLLSDHLAPSGQKLGAQRARLVPCAKSKHHPHHPENEACGWCEPAPPKAPTTKTLGELYYEHCSGGVVVREWAALDAYIQVGWEKSAESETEFWLRTQMTYPIWHPEAP